MARRLLITLLVALAAAATPAAASADGDPASDVLLGENVFYPYSPAVSRSLQTTLDAETAAAAKAGLPIKVALIASPVDLGVIPDLFNKPQQYADFLDQEISFQNKQPLLVVMPSGFGGASLSAPVKSAISTLTKPSGAKSDALANAAIAAVRKLAAAAGHPLKGSTAGTSDGGGSATTIVLIILVLAAVATGAALIAGRRRRAPA